VLEFLAARVELAFNLRHGSVSLFSFLLCCGAHRCWLGMVQKTSVLREAPIHVIPAGLAAVVGLAHEVADLVQAVRLATHLEARHELDGRFIAAAGVLVFLDVQADPLDVGFAGQFFRQRVREPGRAQ
jgi:hypothetical protein